MVGACSVLKEEALEYNGDEIDTAGNLDVLGTYYYVADTGTGKFSYTMPLLLGVHTKHLWGAIFPIKDLPEAVDLEVR